jgi:hypothetical protein
MCNVEHDIDKSCNYPQLAIKLLMNYIFEHKHEQCDPQDISIVSFNYILGGWKATLRCAIHPGMQFVVTFNKNTFEVYIDEYIRTDNLIMSCEYNE